MRPLVCETDSRDEIGGSCTLSTVIMVICRCDRPKKTKAGKEFCRRKNKGEEKRREECTRYYEKPTHH